MLPTSNPSNLSSQGASDMLDMDEFMDMFMMIIMIVVMVSVMQLVTTQNSLAQAQTATTAQGVSDYRSLSAIAVTQEVTFANPLVALSVENLGTVTMYVHTNTLNSEAVPVEQGEAVNIDAGGAVIQRLFYYTRGGVTQGRVTGLY